eukprot:4449814-Prymnesium_polylepis.1
MSLPSDARARTRHAAYRSLDRSLASCVLRACHSSHAPNDPAGTAVTTPRSPHSATPSPLCGGSHSGSDPPASCHTRVVWPQPRLLTTTARHACITAFARARIRSRLSAHLNAGAASLPHRAIISDAATWACAIISRISPSSLLRW